MILARGAGLSICVNRVGKEVHGSQVGAWGVADLGWEGSRPSIPDLPQPEILKINYMLPRSSV